MLTFTDESFNPASLASVVGFLKQSGFRPSRSLGQNFLIDANTAKRIIDSANLLSSDTVLEIGPGLGALTGLLAEKAAKVIAVEKDYRLYKFLQGRFENRPDIELIRGDMLEHSVEKLGANKVVANLPYSTGSRILANMFMSKNRPDLIVVTVQLEVAQRLAAERGTSDFGLLSVWAQADYRIEIMRRVRATCFYPKPEIISAVVRMTKRKTPSIAEEFRPVFYEITKIGFSQRRKKLRGVLSAYASKTFFLVLEDAFWDESGIGSEARAGDISADTWYRAASLIEDSKMV